MTERTIDLGGSVRDGESAQCHLMPCRIEHNGLYVKSKEYFWPTIKPLKAGGDEEQGREKSHSDLSAKSNQDPDNPILTASFRGRPLQGRKIELPEGYKGFVVSGQTSKGSDNKIPNKSFEQFTYWNWDELPSGEDTAVKALQWINIANAIHGNVDK